MSLRKLGLVTRQHEMVGRGSTRGGESGAEPFGVRQGQAFFRRSAALRQTGPTIKGDQQTEAG